jgi:hypothetical protein
VILAASRRAVGVVLLGSAAISAVVLTVKDSPDATLYPPAAWVLVAVIGLSGVVLLARPGAATASADAVAAGAFAGVAALQLAGMGAVAFKHWEPFHGMSGGGDHVWLLRLLAVVLAGVALVSVVACVRLLVAAGAFPVRSSSAVVRWTAVVVGVAVVLAVPPLVGAGAAETMDVSSLGAYALLYGIPWGASVVATGWLARDAAVAVLLAVLGSTALVAATPQMADIVFTTPTVAFVLAGSGVLVVLGVRVLGGTAPRAATI